MCILIVFPLLGMTGPMVRLNLSLNFFSNLSISTRRSLVMSGEQFLPCAALYHVAHLQNEAERQVVGEARHLKTYSAVNSVKSASMPSYMNGRTCITFRCSLACTRE